MNFTVPSVGVNVGASNYGFNYENNPYVIAIISIVVIVYGLMLAKVGLPDYIRNLFNNTIFRVAFLSLLLIHNFNNSPHVAIAVALVFVLTLDYLSQQEMMENFDYVKNL